MVDNGSRTAKIKDRGKSLRSILVVEVKNVKGFMISSGKRQNNTYYKSIFFR